MSEQRKGLALTLISTVAIIVTVVALFVYTMTQPRIMTVKELVANGAITYEEPVELYAFQLIDQYGEPFTNTSFENKWTILFFGFTHCGGYCPTTLARLNELKSQLKPDIAKQTQIVMVSVDPERDTPERLQAYMATFNPEFIGVTGQAATIKLLSEQFYIPFQKPAVVPEGEHYDVAHGEQLVLINPAGDYHGFFKPSFSLGQFKTTYQSIVISYNR